MTPFVSVKKYIFYCNTIAFILLSNTSSIGTASCMAPEVLPRMKSQNAVTRTPLAVNSPVNFYLFFFGVGNDNCASLSF